MRDFINYKQFFWFFEYELVVLNIGVVVSLLNISFFRKYSIDIKYDKNMFNSDILVFIEI